MVAKRLLSGINLNTSIYIFIRITLFAANYILFLGLWRTKFQSYQKGLGEGKGFCIETKV